MDEPESFVGIPEDADPMSRLKAALGALDAAEAYVRTGEPGRPPRCVECQGTIFLVGDTARWQHLMPHLRTHAPVVPRDVPRAEAGAPAAEPATVEGGLRIDRTLAQGESYWLRTPEAVVDVSCLVGTQVAVWTEPDNNPVFTCHVPSSRALAGARAPEPAQADEAVEQALASARLAGMDIDDPPWRALLLLVSRGQVSVDDVIAAACAALAAGAPQKNTEPARDTQGTTSSGSKGPGKYERAARGEAATTDPGISYRGRGA